MLQTVIHAQNQLGEGPCWDDRTNILYWVDIYGHLIQCYHPATQQYTRYPMPDMVTSIWPTLSGRFIVTTRRSIALWQPTPNRLMTIATIDLGGTDMRFNDSGVDAQGRFWAGSMEIAANDRHTLGATLYQMTAHGTVTVMDTGLGLANGIGWSPDGRTMYLVDSYLAVVFAYTVSSSDGTITQRRPFLQNITQDGVPDGLRVDAAGNVWIALYNGGKVVQYSPQGQLLTVIDMPVAKPTCCVFGGTTLQDLYITTTQEGYPAEALTPTSAMGDLFVTTVAAAGTAMNRFDDRHFA